VYLIFRYQCFQGFLLGEPLPESTKGFTINQKQILGFNSINSYLSEKYSKNDFLDKFYWSLEFQKVYVSAWKSTNVEHINPLFKRIKNNLNV